MNFPLFIARKIYSDKGDRHKVSRPAIRIATIGVAVGLAVMIVTVSVVMGFKHTISNKVTGFGSHITLQNVEAIYNGSPLCTDSTLINQLEGIDRVNHAQRYTLAQGILKTDDDFMGVILKGVGQDYDTTFIKECLVEGQLPQFCDSATTYPLLVSKTMADKLRLHAGDRIFAYFIGQDDVKARRFTVTGIYLTNMKRFDDLMCLTDIYATQKINGWQSNQFTGLELLLNTNTDMAFLRRLIDEGYLTRPAALYANVLSQEIPVLDITKRDVLNVVKNKTDLDGNYMTPQTIVEAYPQIFSWLQLLDINVIIILALMIAVAGFTMISGLLIIILERTQMIGILKALGAHNIAIAKTFLWFGTFVIGRGLLWGNIIGIGIVLLQQYTGIITLDPQTYYVSQAPVELSIPLVVLVNLCTLVTCIAVLIVPSMLVMFIHPARSMHYE